MAFCNSPLNLLAYTDSLSFFGNKDKKYTIILPENEEIITWYTRDMFVLPSYYENVECFVDSKKIMSKLKDTNLLPCTFFLVNDSLFLTHIHDRPITNWEQWVPYCAKYCTAFFVYALRHSTHFIFDDCPIPVFPLPNTSGGKIEKPHIEYCHSLKKKKDIPIFFNGRTAVRRSRKGVGTEILRNFPDAHIKFLDSGEALSSRDYVDLMNRSKIVWSPRSVWSAPDDNCNCPPQREFEAMCLESMVIKHPIGTTEPEERIPGVHFVEYNNDNADLIEKLHYYLDHDDERKEIAHNGRLWWERNCSPLARSSFMLKSCLQAMGELCDPSS